MKNDEGRDEGGEGKWIKKIKIIRVVENNEEESSVGRGHTIIGITAFFSTLIIMRGAQGVSKNA